MSGADASSEHRDSVAEVLERLRAGVRQRQGELACLDEQRGERPALLASIARDAALEEPSFRAEGMSRLRELVERAAYVLFARRQHRTLLQQQNRFNRNAALALDDLHARQESLSQEIRRLARRVAELERGRKVPDGGDPARDRPPTRALGGGSS